MPRATFLSAIVIAQNNEGTIARTVRSIVAQECPKPFEVILVHSGSDRTAEIVRTSFPQVRIVDLGRPVLPGKARNEGLAIAQGDHVSFPGSHVELPPGSLAARMAAHEKGYAMVTGTILNGTDTQSGWASYFLDHSASLPGRPSGPLDSPPNSCSYDRQVLIGSGAFPEDRRAGEDTVVNQRLWDDGFRAYRDNQIVLTHVTRCRSPWRLAGHHFNRGRAWGRILHEAGHDLHDLEGYIDRRLTLIDDRVNQWGHGVADRYNKAKHLVRLGVTSAWLGANSELAELHRLAKHSSDASAPGCDTTPFSTGLAMIATFFRQLR